MWAKTWGSSAAMLVWMAVNQELAVGASLQRSTIVCCPSGECSSSSLQHGGKRRRSGMVRFLLMKHIFRPITFRSLEPLCLGEPESSLPLQLGDCGRTPSHGRSATRDGFLNSGETSRMYFTVGRGKRETVRLQL
ncbi:hypothetical protein NHX12_003068 [Muraenolepis orangiensis]|uniref:Secreted protein n=1 Tax=Muraenolepis orangiensis TaxID=630683 RepID=A0A9Q0IFB3_9TELE|nr:hypothetical protein NHX12_003068 [Muraenolepis orangiensis]